MTKRKPKGHGVHHFDFAKYSLILAVENEITGQGVTVLIKEGDDLVELIEMADGLADHLPSNARVTVETDERLPQWGRSGTQAPSAPRNHRYEWVEDE